MVSKVDYNYTNNIMNIITKCSIQNVLFYCYHDNDLVSFIFNAANNNVNAILVFAINAIFFLHC